ncbi:amidase signature enzyme [Tuber magnatum]|uniref:Amidase signature enzyme n=1 Tax=Tuber magnatum TaxID=42249 RepID=A0A317T0G8_9PEZI|nr:amidase signature enzyme [Tuber magnatum]
MAEAINPKGVGYPEPIAAPSAPYVNPRPSNPTLTGLPLRLLSEVVSSLGPLQSILWSNANFDSLRRLEESGVLDRFLPRFDPTVIPSTLPAPAPSLPSESSTTSSAFNSSASYTAQFTSGKLTPTTVVNERLLPLLTSPKSPHSACVITPVTPSAEASASTSRYAASTAHTSGIDGVPVLVKDEFTLVGTPRTMGLTKAEMTRRAYSASEEGQTSWCVQKLIDAGALVVGKANMHEIGFDTTNNNPNWGTPRNPYNKDYYPGGSSGGCAYAVGAGLVPIAVGADGGGSIRIPADHCGVYGLKPTHGRVSARPTLSIAASNGVVGPIAATMSDLELAYRIMAIPDPHDPVSINFPQPTKPPIEAHTGKRIIGIYKPWFEDCDQEIKDVTGAAVKWLETEAGYEVVDIEIPYLKEGRTAHAITIMTEIGQGFCKGDASGLTPANKMLVAVSNKTPARDFNLAQRVRAMLMSHLSSLFATHTDSLIILSPVTPHIGVKIGSESHVAKGGVGICDPNTSLKSMQYVFLANFTGCPSISVPVGYSPTEGVPIGLMGMAAWGGEEVLLGLGECTERYFEGVVGRKKGGDEEGKRGGVYVDILAAAGQSGGGGDDPTSPGL